MIEPRTPEKIHMEIAELLSKGVTYLDALVEYAKKHNLEIETLGEIVKKSSIIKEKIKEEALTIRMVKRDPNERKLCD